MTGCSAVGCNNSSTNGFIMKYLPKDPTRRKEWAIKMKRANWKPTNASALCAVHFAPEMWEKTWQDGSRKLKLTAVPTIFAFIKENPRRKLPTKRQIESELPRKTVPEAVAKEPMFCLPGSSRADTSCHSSLSNSLEKSSEHSTISNDISSLDTSKIEEKMQLTFLKNAYYRKSNSLCSYVKKLRAAKYKIKVLQKRVEHSGTEQQKILKNIFNEDQLTATHHNICVENCLFKN